MSENSAGSQLRLPETVQNYLDGAGNSEFKIGVSMYFHLFPGEYSATEVAHELTAMQGEFASLATKSSAVYQKCARSLAPVGGVIELAATSNNRQTWRAVPELCDTHLALDGFLGDWSLRWPHMSVQQVYGTSASQSAHGRSPRTRQAMYEMIVRRTEAGMLTRTKDLRAVTPDIAKQLGSLTALGILEKTLQEEEIPNPILLIDHTDYRNDGVPLEDTSPETRIVYAALGKLGAGVYVLLDQVVAAAKQIDPVIDAPKLQQRILRELRRGNLPVLVPVDDLKEIPSKSGPSPLLAYGISAEARQPIKELVEGLTRIATGETIEENKALAADLLCSPSKLAALIDKSQRFSSSVKRAAKAKDSGA